MPLKWHRRARRSKPYAFAIEFQRGLLAPFSLSVVCMCRFGLTIDSPGAFFRGRGTRGCPSAVAGAGGNCIDVLTTTNSGVVAVR
jgi:hypothetical protein